MAQRSVGGFNLISFLSMSSSASLHFFFFLKKEKLANRKIWASLSGLPISSRFKRFKDGFQISSFFAMSGLDTWPIPGSTGLTDRSSPIFRTMLPTNQMLWLNSVNSFSYYHSPQNKFVLHLLNSNFIGIKVMLKVTSKKMLKVLTLNLVQGGKLKFWITQDCLCIN